MFRHYYNWTGPRAFLLIVLALVFFGIDTRSDLLKPLRHFFLPAAAFIYRIVDWPIQSVGFISDSVSTHKRILEENTQLRRELIFFQNHLQKLEAIKNENQQLKALLQSTLPSEDEPTIIVGQLLAISSEPYSRIFVINKGAQDGASKGQIVLDAYGVIGQVFRTSAHTSEVLVISDPRSAVPVQNQRNNIRAIAAGSGGSKNSLFLLNVPSDTDIELGDVFITSGLGERYPYGYPVGVVSAVKRNTGNGFSVIELVPSAHLNRSRLVLLLEQKPKK